MSSSFDESSTAQHLANVTHILVTAHTIVGMRGDMVTGVGKEPATVKTTVQAEAHHHRGATVALSPLCCQTCASQACCHAKRSTWCRNPSCEFSVHFQACSQNVVVFGLLCWLSQHSQGRFVVKITPAGHADWVQSSISCLVKLQIA